MHSINMKSGKYLTKKTMRSLIIFCFLVCFFSTASALCGNGILELGEFCDLGAGNGAAGTCCDSLCMFRPMTRVCRPSAGGCDVEEKCTGLSATCPSDEFLSNSTVCRSANGACDEAEYCTGSAPTCPTNNYKANGTLCRPSMGDCDPAEYCTGASNQCPSDTYAPNSQMCRAQNGTCDVAEYCTGVTPTCPIDSLANAGTVCRPANGSCDIVETCNGVNNACPVDSFHNSSTECRPSAGVCDIAETCPGNGPLCPADSLQSSLFECRLASGDCDVAETCTGLAVTCPKDEYEAAGIVCNPAQSDCDDHAVCTGTSPVCPPNPFLSSNTVCRPSSGDCDPLETCTGISDTCPSNVYYNSSVLCRSSGGACDTPEYCTGVSATCPIDVFLNSSVMCRSADGVCDVPEFCTGNNVACPSDVLRDNTYICAAATTQCTFNATCTGLSTTCPSNLIPAGAVCSLDNNYCFVDRCAGNGTCVRTGVIDYNDNRYCNGVETCNTTNGYMIPGTPINCDDGDSCTIDSCNDESSSCVYTAVHNSAGSCGGGLGACTPGNFTCNGTGPSPVITCVGEVLPVNETCGDSIDNDCDGQVDEYCSSTSCTTTSDCLSLPLTSCETVECVLGDCVVTRSPVNSSCNDDLSCTDNDKCTSLGTCVGTPIVCDDYNDCTEDRCVEPHGGCVFDAPALEGTDCVSSNPQSLASKCNNQGECIDILLYQCAPRDFSKCQEEYFDVNSSTCKLRNVTTGCEDGDACTSYDVCVDGSCVGTPKSCDDFIPCTTDVCVSPSGQCVNDIIGGYCYIDGRCWATGDVNPYCPCTICNASKSTIEWSFRTDSGSCNDNDPCTENDVCDVIYQECRGTPKSCSVYDSQCTAGVCVQGECKSIPINENVSCNDGKACTYNDECIAGVCTGSSLDCSTYSTDCMMATCNDISMGCVSTPVADFTECNFGADVCSGQYYCLSGTCVTAGPVNCTASTNPCTVSTCNTDTGCTETPLTGFSCDDSNLCTIGDSCDIHGNCIPGDIRLNCDDENPCTDDFCTAGIGCVHIPVSNCQQCNFTEECSLQTCNNVYCIAGTCQYFPLPTGASCTDGDVCNGREVCTGNGVCVSEGPLICDDGNPCTDDTCDSFFGCQFSINTSNTCDDNDPCTSGDTCGINGICQGTPYSCPESTTCEEFFCAVVNNVPECIRKPINVGSWCPLTDSCSHSGVCTQHGYCQGVDLKCPSPQECVDSVSCVNGTCVPVYTSIGTPCRVNNLCVESLCDGNGQCVYTSDLVNCSTTEQCQLTGVCIPETGLCAHVLAPDDSPCDDNDLCTGIDTCRFGICVGSNRTICSNPDQCHDQGTCDPNTGLCVNSPLPDYTPCHNNDKCTTSTVCISGVCVPHSTTTCDDTNQCLVSRCDPNQGCLYDFVAGICDDGNACTFNETCVEGVCTGGIPVNCSYENTCGVSYCHYNTGCSAPLATDCHTCFKDSDCPYVPCKNGTCQSNICVYKHQDMAVSGCNDGQYCNGEEFCHLGTCFTAPPPNCDDDNECTIDTCSYDRQQCVHTPTTNISCTSDNACAISAQCDGMGHCLPTAYIECEIASTCTSLLGCNPNTGICDYDLHPDGIVCDDHNPCTTLSTCNKGVCNAVEYLDCSSECSCDLPSECIALTGECSVPQSCEPVKCDDGIPCTAGDTCHQGICNGGTTLSCAGVTYDQQCQVPVCAENGTCIAINVMDRTPCSIGIPVGPCSGDDVCISGECVRTYAPGRLCREASLSGCDVPDLCVDGNDYCPDDVYAPDNTSCPSTLFCYDSLCNKGKCLPAIPKDCSHLNSDCTFGVCDEQRRACRASNVPDQTPCISGQENQCVPYSTCISGVCNPHYSNEITPCNDGNICTHDSFCSGYDSTCLPGTPTDCSYLDSDCGSGFCDTLTGNCQIQSMNEGMPCSIDGSACSTGDYCHAGYCVAGATMNCSYLNSSCQYGVCDPDTSTCVVVITGPQCEPGFCSGGCTVPFVWWALHNSHCKSRSKRFTWPNHLEDVSMCGSTYYTWSQKRARNAWRLLMHEWLAAVLNEANGACMPSDIVVALNSALDLLVDCNMTINITGAPGKPYRQLANKLNAYNYGSSGPGTCTRPACAGTRGDSYFSCLFPSLQSRGIEAIEDDVAPEDCVNGVWNYISDTCDCEMGWGGAKCIDCDIPDLIDYTYLCVPSIDGSSSYILRAIPDIQLYMYINEENPEERYQVVQLSGRDARYPGDGVVDCACNVISTQEARDVITYGDISVYITEIERNLQECESVFQVVVVNNNQECDPNTTETVIIDDAQENCTLPEDWNYICDCCFEDDDDCACAHNDILCLRNHLIDNHRKKELYQLLFVIFMTVFGFIFMIALVLTLYRWRSRRIVDQAPVSSSIRKKKPPQSVPVQFPSYKFH